MPSAALIAATSQNSSSPIGLLLPLVLIFAAGYFLIIRPNQQRQKKQRETTSQVGVGDEIVTIGGIVGTVVSADEERLTIRCAGQDGASITILRQAVGRRVEPEATEGAPSGEAGGDGE